MTADERQLILALTPEGLPREDFLRKFRASSDGQELARVLLEEAISSKQPDDVECALMVGYTFGFTLNHLDVLIRLATADWHFKHEDVVTALGQLQTPKAVDALYGATQWIPAYLDFDESRALAVKAIWALGKIAGQQAEEVLITLSKSSDPILLEEANRQLQKRHKPS